MVEVLWVITRILFVVYAVLLVFFMLIVLLHKIQNSKWFYDWETGRNFKQIYKFKGLKQIKLQRIPFNQKIHDCPLSDQDISDFLARLQSSYSTALVGIDTISIEDREEGLSHMIFASYTPEHSVRSPLGAVIRLYPLERDIYETDKYRYYVDEDKNCYWLLTEQEAKNEMLFSLGHEFGHNVIYSLERRMFGGEIEKECDEFAISIGESTIERDLIENRELHSDGQKVGYYATVYGEDCNYLEYA